MINWLYSSQLRPFDPSWCGGERSYNWFYLWNRIQFHKFQRRLSYHRWRLGLWTFRGPHSIYAFVSIYGTWRCVFSNTSLCIWRILWWGLCSLTGSCLPSTEVQFSQLQNFFKTMSKKHDLRPILTCRTRNSATATATVRNLHFWWSQLTTATAPSTLFCTHSTSC